MLFSIVIPVFNRALTIEYCINSVLSQTNQDFEIIVVDDGSTDNTKEIVQGISDWRIKYIYQENGGASKARNTGIEFSVGKYVAFLDSDDVFLPHHLENALVELEKSKNNCVYTQVIVNRGNGIHFLKPHRSFKKNEHISDYLMRDRGFVQTSTLIVPKSLAVECKYDERISVGDDVDFAIKLCHNGGRLIMLPFPGAIWNDQWNEYRLSSKNNLQERINWLIRIKPMLTEKAFLADMGWPVASGLSERGHYLRAMNLYFKALFNGCYRPKMALVIFLQIVLSKPVYRKISDLLAKIGFKP